MRFSVSIEAIDAATSASRAMPRFSAVQITPVPMRLVKTSASPGTRAGVGLDARGMNGAGDRVAELDLVVVDAVAAEDGAAGLVHLLGAALEDLLQVRADRPLAARPGSESAEIGRPPIA